MPAGGISVGIDIGGTFTDLVAFNPETHQLSVAKARTTPRELTGGGPGAVRQANLKPASVESVLPEAYICTSSEIARMWREYERSATTALNAFVGPQVAKYVAQLEALAKQAGYTGRLHMMQSSGGVMTAAQAKRYAVGMVESG